VVDSIHDLDGLAVASHIDREAFGIIGQLGFVPGHLHLEALELSRNISLEEAQRRFLPYRDFAFVRFSDAHGVEEIGARWTAFWVRAATAEEIRKALRGEEGRRAVLPDFSAGGPASEEQASR